MPYYLVNVGYLIVLCAFLVRDMLLLRSLLLTAQIIVAFFSYTAALYTTVTWNLIFAAINIAWIVILLRARREVRIPDDLREVYHRHFPAMTPAEFLQFWRLGRLQTLRDIPLVKAGTQPPALYLLMRGTARVTRDGSAVTTLPAGYFIGEMSLLTGRPANADVEAAGEVEAMVWPTRDLLALRDRNAALWIRLQSAIGYDLVAKVQRVDQRLTSVRPSLAVS